MIVKTAQCWVAAPDDVLSLQLGQLLAGFHHATSLFLEHLADKVQIMSQCEGSQYMCIRHLVTSLLLCMCVWRGDLVVLGGACVGLIGGEVWCECGRYCSGAQ